jgi:hypothetical protein
MHPSRHPSRVTSEDTCERAGSILSWLPARHVTRSDTGCPRHPPLGPADLARRLLTLCYYALRDEDGCRAFPVPPTRTNRPNRGRARSPQVMASSGTAAVSD